MVRREATGLHGIKDVISGVFGSFSDKREIQAFAAQEAPYDFSANEDIWVDVIADLGDGFNSTYTLAHLLAQDELMVGNEPLKRGDILIMNGDEVYPTPERLEYQNRLQGPYEAAFPCVENQPEKEKPKLFAIPGNHDWYDGLTNFIRLFCQGRAMGNWPTMQKRSYFAIRLPHRYWLICIDIQLKDDIDDPQLDYFKDIAKNSFEAGDKVILCTAEPFWVYASISGNFDSEQRIRFFIDEILYGKGDGFYGGKNKSLQIPVILTGDLHHYSRYETEEERKRTNNPIHHGWGWRCVYAPFPFSEKGNCHRKRATRQIQVLVS